MTDAALSHHAGAKRLNCVLDGSEYRVPDAVVSPFSTASQLCRFVVHARSDRVFW